MTFDEDFATLRRARDLDALDGLEAAVWAGIAARREFSRSRDLVLRWQALAVALAVFGSLAGGLYIGREPTAPGRLDAFSAHGVPAPSRLLLGGHT